MNKWTYDEPLLASYSGSLDVSSAGNAFRLVSPISGLKGRIISLTHRVTTAVTVAASDIDVGNSGDDDAYATQAVAIGAAGTGSSTFTNNTDGDSDNLIATDTEVIVSTDGAATAGVVDWHMIIGWF